MPIKEFLGRMAGKVADKLGEKKEAEKPAIQDGNAPVPGAPESPYGPNNEDLKEKRPELVKALQSLILERRLADAWSQRQKIARIKLAREFLAGNHYGLSGDAQSTPAGLFTNRGRDDEDDATGPRFQFVTNFYAAYGLTFCSIMSQDVPHPEFYPVSRESQEDITLAKVIDDVVDVIERNNKPKSLLVSIANRFWTDGIIGTYVRYVVDGNRFGYKTMPIQGSQQSNLDGVPVTLPTDEGEERIPNGQEVISIIGGLELAGPNYADDFQDWEYLQWNCEPATSKLKALYPKAADGIQANSGLGAEQVYERIARLGVKLNSPALMPGDALNILATFSRTWLRPWAFKGIEDSEKRVELEKLFPDGCYIAFAGFEYCESRNESMDDHWRVKHALPGDGQARPSAGDPLISVNERYNTLSNIQTETFEYGIPPQFADPSTLLFDTIKDQDSEPATIKPAKARPGLPLDQSFHEPEPAKMDASIPATMQELMGPVAQFLSGIVPTVAGGEMDGAGETATGYAMARDQAMGRLGLIWRAVQEAYFEAMFLAVKCFKENRPGDVEVPFKAETDTEEAKWIRQGDLSGNIMLKGEPDADMPRMKGEQRAMLDKLFAMAENPLVMKTLTMPINVEEIQEVYGTALEVYGASSRTKQMRETQILVSSGPFQAPPQMTMQPGPDGQPMQAMVQPPPQPTVPVGKYDLHEIELAQIVEYLSSDQGQELHRANPAGEQNLILHADMHAAAIEQKNKANAPPPKPPSESIALKDLPTSGKVQMAAQSGIQLNPAEMDAKEQQDRADKGAELQAKLAGKQPAQGAVNG